MQNKKAYVWSLTGKILPQVIYLVTTMLLARFLTPDDFGILGVLTIFIMVANMLVEAGFGGSLINEKVLQEKDCSTVFTFSFVTSLLLYGVMFVSAPFIETFYKTEGLTDVVRVLCLVFVISAFQVVPSSILVKELKFDRLTIIRIVAVVLASLTSLSIAYLYRNVYALVAFQLVQALVYAILVNLKQSYKVSLSFRYDCFKRLFSFGFYTTLSNVIDTIYENLLATIFGKALSIQQAGYLTQAKRLEESSTQTITQTINATSFPILTKKKDNPGDFQKEANAIFRFSVRMITPLMLVLVLYSEPIITLLFGKQWKAAAPYLSLLSIAGIVIIMETLNRTFIKSLGKVSSLFVVSLVKRGLGVCILLGCVFVDITTIMYGYIASSVLAYLMNQWLYCKHLKTSYFLSLGHVLRCFIPSIIFLIFNIAFFLQTDVFLYRTVSTLIMLLIYYYLTNRAVINNLVLTRIRKGS